MVVDDPQSVPASGPVDAIVRDVLHTIVDDVRTELGSHCLAVVLGGSLARNQGMAVREGESERLLSDMDIYVVRDEPAPQTESALGDRLRAAVRDHESILPPLDLAFVSPSSFLERSSTLHMQQLLHGHRLLYRRADVDAEAWFRESPVSIDEAQRLLLNRLCENIALRHSDDLVAHVHRLKLMIDAPLAFLASVGAYVPSRHGQVERLTELCKDSSRSAKNALREHLEQASRWRHDALRRVLTKEEWSVMATEADALLPQWIGPLLRATLSVSTDSQATPAARWSHAWEGGILAEKDRESIGAWCTRGGRWSCLRRARQWAPLAPQPISAWWHHGSGGSGVDRIYSAAAQRWGGMESWRDPLRALFSAEQMKSFDGPQADRKLGQLWSDWVLGGGRR